VKYLVDTHHCDPSHSDACNLTSLNHAAVNGRNKVVDFFIEAMKSTFFDHGYGFMQTQSPASSSSSGEELHNLHNKLRSGYYSDSQIQSEIISYGKLQRASTRRKSRPISVRSHLSRGSSCCSED
jgi:hypothetical protein